MPLRRIELVLPTEIIDIDTVAAVAEQHEVLDFWHSEEDEKGRRVYTMICGSRGRQELVDACAKLVGMSVHARYFISRVDATHPDPVYEEEEGKDKKKSVATTREELRVSVMKGGKLDVNFLVLTFLSGIAAAIGLAENNVAVVIGAMVIAPLLGPNIALSLSAALGEVDSLFQSLLTNLAGIAFAFFLGAGLSYVWPVDLLASEEVMARTQVNVAGIALALVSGVAASLSIIKGLPSTLVGVMVAVALLPPALTAGMMAGRMEWSLMQGALLLLAANITSVNVTAQSVFIASGIKPRTWLEKRQARQSRVISLGLWAVGLVVVLALVLTKS